MADIVLTIDPDDTSFALHDRANGRRVLGFDAPVPEPDSQWASSADTEGARRANLRYPNRVITVQVMLDRSTDALLQTLENTLGQKIGKLAREGGELQFTYPSGTAITFNVLEASMRRMFDPAEMFKVRARYELTFICEPFGLGTETDLGDNTETTLPCLVFTEASIPGDVAALGRLVIDNDASADQFWTTWGIESRYYSSSANAALFYEAEGRSALGGSATASGVGASGPPPDVMRNTDLLASYQAILSTQATGGGAHLSHVGAFKVYVSTYVPASNTGTVTIAWEWGEGDFLRATRQGDTTIDPTLEGNWLLLDMGLVTLRPVTAGTQRWEGRVLAKSTVVGDEVDIDYLMFVPVAEGSGIVSAVSRVNTPTAFSARDEFTGTTAGNALNGRVAPVGGTWSTSGDATDLTFNDSSIASGSEGVGRTVSSPTSGRFAVLGSTNYANVVVQVSVGRDAFPNTTGYEARQGILARWTDSSNHLKAYVRDPYAGDGTDSLVIAQVVSGGTTILASADMGTDLGVWGINQLQRLRLSVTTNGRATAELYNASGTAVVASCSAYSVQLATGGTLATGKPGFWDYSVTSTHGRYYDDFLVWVPVPDAAIFANQSLEIRHDRVQREDSAGGLWAPVSSYQGDYLLVPPSGAENRTSRIIVKTCRSDPSQADPSIDDVSARLFVTPRYYVIPT